MPIELKFLCSLGLTFIVGMLFSAADSHGTVGDVGAAVSVFSLLGIVYTFLYMIWAT